MTQKTPFPPIPWLWRDYRRAAAWYSGDPERLRGLGGHSFWNSAEDIRLHVPIAADIAAMSASLVFAQSPVIRCADARTQARIGEIFERAGIYPALLQAAELASVYGGVFLKLSWSRADGFPRLSAVPADCGLPVWRNGRLAEIRLWSVLREEGMDVWRLEESYTPDGCIRSRLLLGSKTELGLPQPLEAIPESRGVRPVARSGAKCMLAFYVPNLLPGRSHPHEGFGRSDFDSLYGLFDALDEAYSAIQRETRMTKTTVIVPAEYLRRRDAIFGDANPGWVYANNSGAFTALDIDSDRSSSPITVVNPEPHAASRVALCEDLVRRILTLAGYAPQSAGLDVSGQAESGTALALRERRSLRTAEAKKTLWWQALGDVVRALLKLDAQVFASGVDAGTQLSIELPGGSETDPSLLCELIERLEQAGAVSVQTKVSMLHPDWSEEARAAEVQRILAGRAGKEDK